MGLIFLLWVITGIVLLFGQFPHASREHRFLHLTSLSGQVIEGLQAPIPEWGSDVTLEMAGNRAVYRVPEGRRGERVYDAQTLKPVTQFGQNYAEALSSSYTNSSVERIEMQKGLEQWIPWSYYKSLLPFYKCYMNDDARSVVYVSARSGSIVQHTTRNARWIAALGIIPHKLYFLPLLQNRPLWEGILIFLSAVGLLLAVSGIVAGWIRFRQVRNKNKLTPYRKPSYKWHHLVGFFTGFFVFTFTLSGLFSVTGVPDWMAMVDSEKKETIRWQDKEAVIKELHISPHKIWEALDRKQGVKKIEYTSVLGQPQFHVFYDDYQNAVSYTQQHNQVIPLKNWSLEKVQREAERLYPRYVRRVSKQTEYDSWYSPGGMWYQPVPAYKIEFDDEARTWLYINPETGEQLRRLTSNYRLRRWLYRGLHTFNFPFLAELDWLRKTILFILCSFLLVVGVTGFILMLKWIRRTRKRLFKKYLR